MKKSIFFLITLLVPAMAFSANASAPSLFSIPIEFVLFALTLLGIAFLHTKTLLVAVCGLATVILYKYLSADFNLVSHLAHEWLILVNLAGLLIGFAILAKQFENSALPSLLPKILPSGIAGAFMLLVWIFMLSAFLDNIAAALIGGAIAYSVFKGRVHIGYVAAIVAASNAGGSGSVLGDTTTTMMWVDGISPRDVSHAYIAAIPTFVFLALFASRQQHRYQPILKDPIQYMPIVWKNIYACVLILVGAIASNFLFDFPALGVWVGIIISTLFTKIAWGEMRKALPGSIFLLCLVIMASLMPVDALPPASWITAFIMGFVSSVFDNIPLTKLALDQMGYDWGILAFAVGFGGSMLWFGSSAGVAITGIYPNAKSVVAWVKNGWYIIVAYIIGFFILLGVAGWRPHTPHKQAEKNVSVQLVS